MAYLVATKLSMTSFAAVASKRSILRSGETQPANLDPRTGT
jgi:hypothetical protein